jgi:hypothetical protein
MTSPAPEQEPTPHKLTATTQGCAVCHRQAWLTASAGDCACKAWAAAMGHTCGVIGEAATAGAHDKAHAVGALAPPCLPDYGTEIAHAVYQQPARDLPLLRLCCRRATPAAAIAAAAAALCRACPIATAARGWRLAVRHAQGHAVGVHADSAGCRELIHRPTCLLKAPPDLATINASQMNCNALLGCNQQARPTFSKQPCMAGETMPEL